MARIARMALDLTLEASKTLKPALGTAWQYAKIEIVPPMTINFFHGPAGKQIEDAVSKASDGFIGLLQNQIKQIDLAEARELKRREAEAKAAEAKLKAEAKRKADEAKKKEEEAKKNEEEKLAKEAKARQQAEAEKKAEADKKAAAEAAKTPKTAPAAKKDAPKEKAKRKSPKQNRREDKKGSPPKSKK